MQYDDVLNHQRQTVYTRRRAILVGDEFEVEEKLNEILETKGDNTIKEIIKEKEAQLGRKDFFNVVRRIILQTIDMFWVDHLEAMDYLRSSVNLRAYGQRDPLVEYRKEGLRLFHETQDSINEQILRLIPNISEGAFVRDASQGKMQEIHNQAKSIVQNNQSNTLSVPIAKSMKVGRNDPCPCGSGKKYKKCCGNK